MKIIRDSAVMLKYEIRDADGNVIQRAHEPVVYLHGRGGMFPKVEDALAGKEPGEKVREVLSPADAFGEHDPSLVRREPRASFPGKLRTGMTFEGEVTHGDHTHPMRFRVVHLDADEVTLDGNHPLAGQTIEFRATVIDVRPATPDEIAHGHAHGPGGHHH